MEQYPTNENTWIFWLCCVLFALFCSIVVAYFCVGCRKVTITKEEIYPIKYKIDGVSMTYDNVVRYYYKELGRGRRKNTLHLLVYDTENNKVMYDSLASDYIEKKPNIC